MQTSPIYSEGEKVYVKTVDGGQKMLYVEEVLAGARYTLRKGAKRGVDVLEDTYAEENLSDEPYEQGYVQVHAPRIMTVRCVLQEVEAIFKWTPPRGDSASGTGFGVQHLFSCF